MRPDLVYKNKGWQTWGKWLGTEFVALGKRKYRNFSDAKKYINKLNLKSNYHWRDFIKTGQKPNDIPSNPHRVYEEWISWNDWLGNNK